MSNPAKPASDIHRILIDGRHNNLDRHIRDGDDGRRLIGPYPDFRDDPDGDYCTRTGESVDDWS